MELAAGDEEGAREYDLRIRQDRTQVYGYSDPNLKQKPKDIVKTVDKATESVIIDTYKSFGNYYYGSVKSSVGKKIVKYFKKGLK